MGLNIRGLSDPVTHRKYCTETGLYYKWVGTRYKQVLVVTEVFNIAVNDFDAEMFVLRNRVLVQSELRKSK